MIAIFLTLKFRPRRQNQDKTPDLHICPSLNWNPHHFLPYQILQYAQLRFAPKLGLTEQYNTMSLSVTSSQKYVSIILYVQWSCVQWSFMSVLWTFFYCIFMTASTISFIWKVQSTDNSVKNVIWLRMDIPMT